MRVQLRAAVLMVLVLLGGCGIQFSNLDPAAKVNQGSGEAVVVLAVDPRARVSLFRGESHGLEWTCKSLFNIANVYPEHGFIVLKLAPRTGNQNYGIGQVLPDGIGGDSFIVRRNVIVPAFHAPAGQVTFVGGIRLTRYGQHLTIAPHESTTGEDVERFLKTAYPGLAGNVTQDPLVFLRADGGC